MLGIVAADWDDDGRWTWNDLMVVSNPLYLHTGNNDDYLKHNNTAMYLNRNETVMITQDNGSTWQELRAGNIYSNNLKVMNGTQWLLTDETNGTYWINYSYGGNGTRWLN